MLFQQAIDHRDPRYDLLPGDPLGDSTGLSGPSAIWSTLSPDDCLKRRFGGFRAAFNGPGGRTAVSPAVSWTCI